MKLSVKIWVSVLIAPLLNESKRLQRVKMGEMRGSGIFLGWSWSSLGKSIKVSLEEVHLSA